MKSLVIHRKPHPEGWRRWFTYRGRDFFVQYSGSRYDGYYVVDVETCGEVFDNVFTLDEVRREALGGAIEVWASDSGIELARPDGTHMPNADTEVTAICPDPAKCWHGELFTGDCCECCGTVIA